MARLLTTAAIRDPKPSRPGAAIQTHRPAVAAPPNPATGAAPESLHGRLHSAWQARDWPALARAAKQHLTKSGPEPKLNPITRAALRFFEPGATLIAAGEVERFLRGFGERELAAYLKGEMEADRVRIADDALALQCLGMLGEARFDYIGALRSLEALRVSSSLWDRKGEPMSPIRIRNVLEEAVELPHFSFEIEVCRDSRSGDDWLIESPLERRIAQVRRGVERQQAREGDEKRDPCDCKVPAPVCEPQDFCCGKVNYYIAELLELRDWLHRYKAAEIAYIEVVAAGESRSREHEMKRTRELFSETETTERTSEMRDLQVTDRSNLKREIERQQQQTISADATTTGKYDMKAYSFSATISASFSRTSSEAIREAQEQSVETVKKAVSEIEKQIRVTTSERLTTEETEKNLHSHHNTTTDPFVTQYFWVTQERRAQLYSYGLRMLAEFIVPEPARLYEHLVDERREAEIDDRIRPPRGKRPKAPDFDLEPKDIVGENYRDHCDKWGVKNPPSWPPPTMEISGREGAAEELGGEHELNRIHLDIPAGYEATGMRLDGGAQYIPDPEQWQVNAPWPRPRKVELIFSAGTLHFSEDAGDKRSEPFAPHITGSHDVRVTAWNTTYVEAILVFTLVRLPGAVEAWQAVVYALLLAEYEKQLAIYEEKMKPWDAYDAARDVLRRELKEAERSRHPFHNRELERTELKRAVIYLMCQDFSVDGAIIRKAEPCGLPEIHRTKTARKGYDWYFWDRLIDWKQMAYAFFDYFWNPICDWPQRFDPDEPDALFKSFHRAGYARVIVPVSVGMEGNFVYYVNTHSKWGPSGQPPFNPNDSRWRNVVNEIRFANAAAMTAREGHVVVAPPSPVVVLKGSDRYWDAGPTPTAGVGSVDSTAIGDDIDREVFIEGEIYLVSAIAQSTDSLAPQFDPAHPNSMWWDITLDRPYVGAAGARLYSMGAKAVAPMFGFDLPTELIWAGAHNKCLPAYPLPPCVE